MKKPLLSLAALLGLALSTIVSAGQVYVSPVIINVDATTKTQAVQITNPGTEAVTYQATLLKWTQVEGENVLTPTEEVLASPLIIKIEGGQKRALRFMRMSMNPTIGQFYKLQLRELPSDVKPEETKGMSGAVRIYYNLLIPVGFQPKGASPAHLSATTKNGKLFIHNDGETAFVVRAVGPANEKPWKEGALGWVLPHGGLVYPVDVKAGQSITLSDGKSQTLTVQ